MSDQDISPSEEELLLGSIRQRRSRLNAKPIGSVVRRLMLQKGYGQTQTADRLSESWSQAVGTPLASLTRPGNVSRGVLVIIAENSAALQELYFRNKQILAALQQALPELKIKSIRPRIGSLR